MTVSGHVDPASSVSQRGMTGLIAWCVAALFVAIHTTLAVASGHAAERPLQSIALLLCVAAVVIVVWPSQFRPTAPRTALIVTLCVSLIVSMLPDLPTDGVWPGYSIWHLGAVTFLFAAIAVRGRIGMAWIGMGIVVAIVLVWSDLAGPGFLFGIAITIRHVGILAIGTFFAVGVARLGEELSAAQSMETARLAEQYGEEVLADERRREINRLLAVVAPSLDMIAAGVDISDDQRRHYLAVEGSLRDALRARSISISPLVAAVRDARLDGITVLLFDDSDRDIPDDIGQFAADWIADHLSMASADTFTARLTASADTLRVTCVSGELRDLRVFALPSL